MSIFLLFLFLTGSGGLYYTYRVTRYLNYLQVQHLLSSRNIRNRYTLLAIPDNSLQSIRWRSGNKEFEFHGQLYDVVSSRHVKEITYYYCYRDVKEKRLQTDYARERTSGSHPGRIVKILLANCLPPQSLQGQLLSGSDFEFDFYRKSFISIFVDIQSPPPKHEQLA